jgi:hypothetical protein
MGEAVEERTNLHRDALISLESPNFVDGCGAPRKQTGAHPVQSLARLATNLLLPIKTEWCLNSFQSSELAAVVIEFPIYLDDAETC